MATRKRLFPLTYTDRGVHFSEVSLLVSPMRGLQYIYLVDFIRIRFEIAQFLTIFVEILFQAHVTEVCWVEWDFVTAVYDPFGSELSAGGTVDGLVLRHRCVRRVVYRL